MRCLARRLTASLAVVLLTGPAPAFDIVYDPTAVAKLVDQVQQMEKQNCFRPRISLKMSWD